LDLQLCIRESQFVVRSKQQQKWCSLFFSQHDIEINANSSVCLFVCCPAQVSTKYTFQPAFLFFLPEPGPAFNFSLLCFALLRLMV
jgi:hypothetical protein